MNTSDHPLVILGTPTGLRVKRFQAALRRQAKPAATVVPYEDFLADSAHLASKLTDGAVLRIESPEKNFAVGKLLLEQGAAEAEHEGSPLLPAAACRGLAFDRGRILFPRQAYLGFRRVLRLINKRLLDGNAHAMNCPAEIEAMFDKRECHRRFVEAAIETPPSLPSSLLSIRGYDDFVDRLEQVGWRRAFMKLAHGSSASGVVAFARCPAFHEAITTVEMVRQRGELRLYNSRKIRRYTDASDLRDLIDYLCSQQVHVEKWVPKAQLEGRGFDLRIVVIGGCASHAVVRQGASPITNLHLGNQRGDLSQVKTRLGVVGWRRVEEVCRQTLSLFPHSFYGGVDVLLTRGWRCAAVLEVNAFGDMLPGVFWRGKDIYETEISART